MGDSRRYIDMDTGLISRRIFFDRDIVPGEQGQRDVRDLHGVLLP
jgi:hypothetical protein